MRPDQVPEAGKFRATAAAALDGQTGLWGDSDMLCVRIDANGELVLAALGDCDGVIFTPEGRRESDTNAHKDVIGGKKYTVLRRAELLEAEIGTSPALAEGDKVWSIAGGDVSVSATPGAGAIFIGWVVDGGKRLVLDVNGIQPATA